MPTDEPSTSPSASTRPRAGGAVLDAEVAARRALGIAMNSVWGGAEVAPLPRLSPQLVADAQALVRERVPGGREQELAIELLERSVAR